MKEKMEYYEACLQSIYSHKSGTERHASTCSVSYGYSTSETPSQEVWKRESLKSGDHC